MDQPITTDAYLNARIRVLDNGCWLWTASQVAGGYGVVRRANQFRARAHRYVYELMKGPIPADKQLDHLCRVRLCVNPAHLEPVTQMENIMRGTGASARNARKTECRKGHPLAGENVVYRRYKSTRGHVWRWCLICKREAAMRWTMKRRAARRPTSCLAL